jgi:hypothetical protein
MHDPMRYSHEGEEDIRGGNPVRLSAFLKALTGMKEKNLDLGPDILEEHKNNLWKNGMVFWNHFSDIYSTPDSEDLLKFLHPGMAVRCVSKKSTFNHLFTVYLKQENSDRLDEEHVTFCGVGVKDHITETDLIIRNREWTDTH